MSQTCDRHIFATHGSPSIEKNTWRKASTRENQRSIENNRVGDISASGMKERNTADSGFLLSVTQNILCRVVHFLSFFLFSLSFFLHSLSIFILFLSSLSFFLPSLSFFILFLLFTLPRKEGKCSYFFLSFCFSISLSSLSFFFHCFSLSLSLSILSLLLYRLGVRVYCQDGKRSGQSY